MRPTLRIVLEVTTWILCTGATAGVNAQEPRASCVAAVATAGTDLLQLKSGSMLVGHLKFAERGLAIFDVEGIGETSIKLAEIAELIASSANFQLNIAGRPHTIGRIGDASEIGKFIVSGQRQSDGFEFTDIVRQRNTRRET